MFFQKSPLTQNGSTLVQILILVSMGMVTSFALFHNQAMQLHSVKNMNSPVSAQVAKARVIATLMSDKAMTKTVGCFHNAISGCSSDSPTAADTQLFALYSDMGAGDVVYDARNPQAGFTVNGEPCNGFDLTNGNDDCPFRYEIRFVQAPIFNPLQFKVSGTLLMKGVELRPINTDAYHFEYSNIEGSNEIRHLIETCQAFNHGVLIGANVEAGLASCSSFIKDCAGSGVGIEFDQSGFPKCTKVQLSRESCRPITNWVISFSTKEGKLGCQ